MNTDYITNNEKYNEELLRGLSARDYEVLVNIWETLEFEIESGLLNKEQFIEKVENAATKVEYIIAYTSGYHEDYFPDSLSEIYDRYTSWS